jgi:SAM-dependent methyltransferase
MVKEAFTYSVENVGDDAVRLDLFESMLDPRTLSVLQTIGVPRGARCLEAGAGRGSIVMSLVGMVGPLGEVVATDVDMTWLNQIRHPCLRCVEHDLTADDFEPLGQFDLVHVRMVLHHFGTVAAIGVVEALLGLLRPGGRLLIEDLVNTDTVVDPGSPQAETFATLDQKWRSLAGDQDMGFGLRLPGLLKAGGLDDVRSETWSTVGAGDEPAQQWRRRTLARSRARVLEAGLMTEIEFEQLQELLAQPDLHQLSFLHIASWGTKPTPD